MARIKILLSNPLSRGLSTKKKAVREREKNGEGREPRAIVTPEIQSEISRVKKAAA